MNNRKGPIITMTLSAVLLAGFGFSQFSGVGLGMGEGDEHEHGEAHGERYGDGSPMAGDGPLRQKIAAEYGGRVTEVEREYEAGRLVYEVKLVDAEGRRRELLVDPTSGNLLAEED